VHVGCLPGALLPAALLRPQRCVFCACTALLCPHCDRLACATLPASRTCLSASAICCSLSPAWGALLAPAVLDLSACRALTTLSPFFDAPRLKSLDQTECLRPPHGPISAGDVDDSRDM